MGSSRRKYNGAEQIALVSQVGSVCPICLEPLFYNKKGKDFKNYELAHIYPLHPNLVEIAELDGVERLSDDVNAADNILPLCSVCHGKFDKPRTRDEYIVLFNLKKKIIKDFAQTQVWKKYALEDELSQVLDALCGAEPEPEGGLTFFAKKLDDKLNSSMTRLTKRKIWLNVCDYYDFIKNKFIMIDQESCGAADKIALEVKLFYMVQKNNGHSQQEVFEHLVSWIKAKTCSDSTEASEIVVSFFIQNCEVFE